MTNPLSSFKLAIVLCGDIAVLYSSLIITLIIRYRSLFYSQLFDNHLQPFSVIFAVWILIFYIAGLYDFKSLKNSLSFEKTFWYGISAATLVAALLFYLIPAFEITPRANLIIFFLIFGTLGYVWRRSYNTLISAKGSARRILMVGANPAAEELVEHIGHNPQLGYEIKLWMKEGLTGTDFDRFSRIILENDINAIVIPAHIKKDRQAARLIYQALTLNIEVAEISSLYESIFQKVPLAELEETWFLENLTRENGAYRIIRNQMETVIAIVLSVILLPLLLLIALAVKLTSRGPVIFTQERIGKSERPFTIYKFRTMRLNAEKEGPQWANYFKDARVTPVGALLRWSHLDELPQLINIIKGDLSFVGPRPERPEFVSKLREEIPYYDLRHVVTPGITGWAQINFRYAASTIDSYQKFQYDMYYIKNNSPVLDLLIILKTARFLISNL